MSVVGFVFGLIGMMGSFVPCLGSLAFFVGIPAAVISGIALGVAYSQNAKKTFAVVALTISLIGVTISGWQYFSIISAGNHAERELKTMFGKTPYASPLPVSSANYVVDLAGVIDDAAEARMNTLLRELEKQTTAQLVVQTLPSLNGESIETFSINLANRLKLGQKGKDNGLLITVAVQERRYRIEVGHGLEAALPDSLVGSLGRELLVPAFRDGDFGGGLEALARELAARVKTASGVAL